MGYSMIGYRPVRGRLSYRRAWDGGDEGGGEGGGGGAARHGDAEGVDSSRSMPDMLGSAKKRSMFFEYIYLRLTDKKGKSNFRFS